MIEEHNFSSLKDFSAFVADRVSQKKPCWFRGVQDASKHSLMPSLFRHKVARTADQIKDLESDLMEAFRYRAPPFQTTLPIEPIELLFFMQHHGVPTRLLDWSENPFVSLFFALERALWESDDAPDAAVWMIDPILLNSTALQNNEGSDKILAASDDLLNAYRPDGRKRTSGKMPVAMWGVHNSSRIVAQRGVFLLFGSNIVAMNDDQTLSDANIMTKITIPKNAKRDVAEALFNMGFTDSVIYPDLDGLGREIRNRSGFWRNA